MTGNISLSPEVLAANSVLKRISVVEDVDIVYSSALGSVLGLSVGSVAEVALVAVDFVDKKLVGDGFSPLSLSVL